MRAFASSLSSAVTVGIVVAFAACGGSEQGTPPYSGPPEDAPTISIDDYCAQFAQLSCDAIARCCPGLGAPTDCSSYGPQLCDSLRKGAPAGTSYDPVAGGVCIAAERAASSSSCGAVSVGPSSLAFSACESVFNGGVAPGGACTSVTSCAYQRHAVTGCTGGVCVSKPIVGAGASCVDAICDVDLVCSSSSSPPPSDAGTDAATSSAVCVPAAGAGESCATTTCRHDLYCDATSRTCAAPLADGSPCSASLSCASGSCSGGKCQSAVTCSLGG